MNNRIKKELMLLQASCAKVTYNNNGQWVLIEDYPIPPEFPWNRQKTNVCFQIPTAYPGTPPYGFYVPSGILCDDKSPNNYQDPANNKPPFPGEWGFFSWTQESGWYATDDPHSGSNLLSFVRTLRDRFIEGG